MTGRGWHLTLRVPAGSRLHAELVGIGSPGAGLLARYERLASRVSGAVVMGRAHDGAGRLLEFLAHEVLRRCRGSLPVTLADVAPPGAVPFACLDLSAYGDPLFARYVRCAFSGHQKAAACGLAAPPVVCLPRGRRSLDTMLELREQPAAAARLAARARVALPDMATAPGLVASYRASRLGRFHREFDRGPQLEPGVWPYSYDTLDALDLPACARPALEEPNPLLLRPAHLRTVALACWALGWHPRSVAGLVRSKLERDHGWGDLWERYEPAARADFYVRLFCGAVAAGLETGADFTCESQALRGLCRAPQCGRRSQALFAELAWALEHQAGRKS